MENLNLVKLHEESIVYDESGASVITHKNFSDSHVINTSVTTLDDTGHTIRRESNKIETYDWDGDLITRIKIEELEDSNIKNSETVYEYDNEKRLKSIIKDGKIMMLKEYFEDTIVTVETENNIITLDQKERDNSGKVIKYNISNSLSITEGTLDNEERAIIVKTTDLSTGKVHVNFHIYSDTPKNIFDGIKYDTKEIYIYNENERLITYDDGNGYIETYMYNKLGDFIKEENSTGYCSIIEYNEAGNTSRITFNSGSVEEFKYDENQNLVEINSLNSDGGYLTVYEYDNKNRVISKVHYTGNPAVIENNERGDK